MILFIRIVGVKTFPIRGGLQKDITGPPTGQAQNLGLKKDLEKGELRKKEQDEQSPYSKQINAGKSRLLILNQHSFGGLGQVH
jgi:hypothetical protein